MILASAQTKPTRWDIKKNLQDHYKFIDLASEKEADLIVFPEMSITGYEREKARELAFMVDDMRLDTLRKLAAQKYMIIVVGAPISMNAGLYIGSFILFPDGKLSIYTKQFLHAGEEEFFQSSFGYNPLIELESERISLAICADIDNPLHSENASKLKSTVYIPSIFFSPGGLPGAYNDLSGYAKKYSMNVLMSNFCIESWGRPSGGKSAFWNQHGDLVAAMNDSDPGLLLVKKENHQWTSEILYL